MLELTEIQKRISELILNTPTPGKHCARNALVHIKKAWEIKNIDPEMAVFRAITAEEEAAAAIIHSLKRRNYKGAKKVNHRNHIHKTAISPFFEAISKVLALTVESCKPTLELDTKVKKPLLRVRINVPNKNGEVLCAYPEPPLHFRISVNDRSYDFSLELNNIATSKNTKTIIDYIRNRANTRNQLLYASIEGIPTIESSINDFLKKKKDIVLTHVIVYLLIDPHKQHQLFVQQALNAFLKMLKLIPKDIEFE